jgi:peptidoglycan/LPS O-acetylase OafA/YrhL
MPLPNSVVLPPAPAARRHFASLEALRFFAFFKVFLLHLPLAGSLPVLAYLRQGGGIGVQFFFVLSGFLITYLLVADKQARGQINLRRFLVRRSLRIWPLFYALVALAFVLQYGLGSQPGVGYLPDWRFSFTFLENYKMLLEDNFPRTPPLPVFWSLCIEEHFYVVWMLAVYWLPVRRVPVFLGACLPLAFGFRLLEPHVFHNTRIDTNDLLTHLDVFAVGGLLGYWVAADYAGFSRRVNGLALPWRYLFLGLVVGAVVFQPHVLPNVRGSGFALVRPLIVAALFGGVIALLVAANSPIQLKNRVLTYLGRISYGLYVFHLLVIRVVWQLCFHYHMRLDTPGRELALLAVSLGASVAVSALSFRYFEQPFLRLRDQLTPK